MFTMSEISDDLRVQLKTNRLNQYKSRIYETQMDIAAYQAVGDLVRVEMSQKNLDDFIKSYDAVEAM